MRSFTQSGWPYRAAICRASNLNYFTDYLVNYFLSNYFWIFTNNLPFKPVVFRLAKLRLKWFWASSIACFKSSKSPFSAAEKTRFAFLMSLNFDFKTFLRDKRLCIVSRKKITLNLAAQSCKIFVTNGRKHWFSQLRNG